MAEESKFLQVAKEAAVKGGEVVQRYLGLELQVQEKSAKFDFVTEADIETEKVILSILTKAFPEHGIIAEESGRTRENSEYQWAIDPIDGTHCFYTGTPFYAISIALLKDYKPILGVINLVGMNDLYWAEEDRGVYLNGKQVQVSGRDKIRDAVCLVSMGRDVENRMKRFDERVKPFLECKQIYMLGTSTADAAFVTRGAADVFLGAAFIWDFAAGYVLLKEAGGKMTDWQGEEIDWKKERIKVLGTNGLVHDEAVKLLNVKS